MHYGIKFTENDHQTIHDVKKDDFQVSHHYERCGVLKSRSTHMVTQLVSRRNVTEERLFFFS